MRKFFVVLGVVALSACATREELRRETRGLALDASARHVSDLDRFAGILGQLDGMERRLRYLERDTQGPWDREECENYRPEVQRLFCHRKETVAGKTFEEIADEVAKKVDAEFCAKAREPWRVKAFCPKEKK